jgi:hypothetical protein
MTKEELRIALDARLKEINDSLNNIADEDATAVVALFEKWSPNKAYEVGQRLRYLNKLYRVVQAHISQEGWEPDKVPALFTEIAKPGEIPEWRQPTGAQDAYNTGDLVRYNGQVWESTIDNNVWAPGTSNLWVLKEG